MSVKFATFKDDRLKYYNGSTWIDVMGSAGILKRSASGWTQPFWKGNGNLLLVVASQRVDNPGGSTDIRSWYSEDLGSTWNFLRISAVDTTTDLQRIWPPSAFYSPDNGHIVFSWIKFESASGNRHIRGDVFVDMRTTPAIKGTEGVLFQEAGFYSDSSPDDNDEINISGVGHRGLSQPTVADFYGFLFERGLTSIQLRTHKTRLNECDEFEILTSGASDPLGGMAFFVIKELDEDGDVSMAAIWLDNADGGTIRWAAIQKIDAISNDCSSDPNDYAITVIEDLFDFQTQIRLGSEILGGVVSAFYDRPVKLIHVWAKKVSSSGDNSINYLQIRVDSLQNFRKSPQHEIITLGIEGSNYSIHGGVQDGEVYLLVHDGDGGEVRAYKKIANEKWDLEQTLDSLTLETNGIAHLLVDYDMSSGDTFDTSEPPAAPVDEIFPPIPEESAFVVREFFYRDIVITELPKTIKVKNLGPDIYGNTPPDAFFESLFIKSIDSKESRRLYIKTDSETQTQFTISGLDESGSDVPITVHFTIRGKVPI